MSTQPTDADLKAMWQLHAADIGGIFYYARAVLAKWGTLRADKIVIPTDTMEQEFQQHYRRGYEAGKKASTPQHTQQPAPAQAAEPVARLEIESLKAQLHAAKQINAAQFGLLAASIPGSALRASHGQASSQAAEPVEREPLTDEQTKVLMQAHHTAMRMTCNARVPECGEFSTIAQDLDWLCESFGIKGGQHDR